MLTSELFDLTKTLAAPLLSECKYPWEALPKIKEFILSIGPKLDKDLYDYKGNNIWVAKDVKMHESAVINGPTIICSGSIPNASPKNFRISGNPSRIP